MIRQDKYYRIICDGCGKNAAIRKIDDQFFYYDTLKKTGWECESDTVHYCPRCAKERYKELKPCPFCGSHNIKEISMVGYTIWCEDCLAQIAEYNTKSEARSHWNNRA